MKERKTISFKEATEELNLVRCDNVSNFEIGLIKMSEQRKKRYEQITEEEEYGDPEYYFLENEVYSFYLTDNNESYLDYLVSKYDLVFGYCPELEIWVLLVDFVSQAWSSVQIEVYD